MDSFATSTDATSIQSTRSNPKRALFVSPLQCHVWLMTTGSLVRSVTESHRTPDAPHPHCDHTGPLIPLILTATTILFTSTLNDSLLAKVSFQPLIPASKGEAARQNVFQHLVLIG